MYNYSIFVNTTDKFEDAWYPFFKLFAKYWPDYNGKIYLNTEYKTFQFPGLNIISIRNCLAHKDADTITWSQCLKRALEVIDTDVILYMQEDYFLNGIVKNDIVTGYVSKMTEYNINCLHLTDQNNKGPFSPSEFTDFWLINQKNKDLISCQAALWKKSFLEKYIRPWESPWQFETNGTKRANLTDDKFYTVSREIYRSAFNEIIPYIFTGIVQGRWNEDVVNLFAENNIGIDYNKRGFTKDINGKTLKQRLKKRVHNFPTETISAADLLTLKFRRLFKR